MDGLHFLPTSTSLGKQLKLPGILHLMNKGETHYKQQLYSTSFVVMVSLSLNIFYTETIILRMQVHTAGTMLTLAW